MTAPICPKCGQYKLLSISQEIDKLGLLCLCPHCGYFPWYSVIPDYPFEPAVPTVPTSEIIQDIIESHPDALRRTIISMTDEKTGITYEIRATDPSVEKSQNIKF